MKNYDFNQHVHNYAVWTAARAVQRAFTSTANIKYAIEKSELKNFTESDTPLDTTSFEEFHRQCCGHLIEAFKEKKVFNVSYGRAAKIIAIYLKTSIILVNKGNCARSIIIHPPIDNILLTSLSKEPGLSEIKN